MNVRDSHGHIELHVDLLEAVYHIDIDYGKEDSQFSTSAYDEEINCGLIVIPHKFLDP